MSVSKKANGSFIARVMVRGQTSSKVFQTEIAARNWVEAEKVRLRKPGAASIKKTVAEMLERYKTDEAPKHKGVRWECIRIDKWLRESPICYILLNNLTTDDLQHWVDERCKQVAPASARREFQLLRAALNVARRRWKWIDNNPAADVYLPKKPPPRDRLLKRGELARILDALEYAEGEPIISSRQQVAIAVLIALETAMRQGEIWNIKPERDLYLEQRYVNLPDTKNGTSRNVPLSKRAVELLERLPIQDNGNLFKVRQPVAVQLFRRAVIMAGIEESLHFHDLRHQAITTLAKKLPMLPLARMVGHKDPRSLMIYYNETATELAKMLD